MSNIKNVLLKPRLYVSVNLLAGEYGRYVARLRRCAYAFSRDTAGHDNHEKSILGLQVTKQVNCFLKT